MHIFRQTTASTTSNTSTTSITSTTSTTYEFFSDINKRWVANIRGKRKIRPTLISFVPKNWEWIALNWLSQFRQGQLKHSFEAKAAWKSTYCNFSINFPELSIDYNFFITNESQILHYQQQNKTTISCFFYFSNSALISLVNLI